MLEFFDSAEDVIAVKVSGTVTGDDFDAMLARLDAAMAREGAVHIFAEAYGIDGIALTGFPGYMARAMPLFGKLSRFGRIAVVADQAWVRMATRIESALLPYVSYRVFMPGQREQALAWVEGRSEA